MSVAVSSVSSSVSCSSARSEEHTSELQHSSISYAVFCLKKKRARDQPRLPSLIFVRDDRRARLCPEPLTLCCHLSHVDRVRRHDSSCLDLVDCPPPRESAH